MLLPRLCASMCIFASVSHALVHTETHIPPKGNHLGCLYARLLVSAAGPKRNAAIRGSVDGVGPHHVSRLVEAMQKGVSCSVSDVWVHDRAACWRGGWWDKTQPKKTHTHTRTGRQAGSAIICYTDVIANSANQPTKKHQNRDRIANSGYAYANATTHSGGVLFTWVCICALGIHK